MSDYIHRLLPAAKASYLAKLELLGLIAQGDPYAACNTDRFEDDMTLWPRPTSGSIYSTRPSMQWKSLEAYNYFESGHVREVKIWIISNSNCVLKGLVNPSQRSPDEPHHPWIAVKGDGSIITAHCTR